MRRIAITLFLLLGLWQTAAIFAGLHDWIGLHMFLALPTALFLGAFPVIGAAFATYAATQAWAWSWPWATLAFFGPAAIGSALLAVSYFRNRPHYDDNGSLDNGSMQASER